MTGFKKERIKTGALKKAYISTKNKKRTGRKYVIFYGALLMFFFGLVSVFGLAFYYLHDIPAISKIESDVLPESSIIYDRNGGELYNLYNEEKRTYVPYDQIS